MEKRERELAQQIGKAIASRRKVAGTTQEELAAALGIGPEAVSRMERGQTLPGLTRLLDLADAFHCPVQDLLSASSDRAIERGIQLAGMLSEVGSKDRDFILAIVEQLCLRLTRSD